jgi:hypothetical protein
MFILVRLDGFIVGFSKFRFLIVKNQILARLFRMRWMSLRGNDFFAH